jgi:hypothetical protein
MVVADKGSGDGAPTWCAGNSPQVNVVVNPDLFGQRQGLPR